MAEEKSYYVVDPEGKLTCRKCGVQLVKANAVSVSYTHLTLPTN